jgi:hypothetical protein
MGTKRDLWLPCADKLIYAAFFFFHFLYNVSINIYRSAFTPLPLFFFKGCLNFFVKFLCYCTLSQHTRRDVILLHFENIKICICWRQYGQRQSLGGVPPGGVLCGGADGPRTWARRSAALGPDGPRPMLAPFWGVNHLIRISGGALWSGADSPRHRARWSATWRRARVPCLTVGQSAP